MPKQYAQQLVFMVALGLPLCARAQPISLPTLHWEARAGCPDRAAVLTTIERWLRKAVDPVDARSLTVDARVQGDADDWSMTLELATPTGRGTEQFKAAQCETLVDVMGLKVTLAASAEAAAQQRRAAALPDWPPAAADSGSREARWTLAARGGVLGGVLPEWGGLLELAIGLRLGLLRFELAGSYAPPRAASYPTRPNVGADFQLLAGQMRGCVQALLGRTELPICTGVQLGALIGTGFGDQERFSRAELHAALILGAAIHWPLAQNLFVRTGVDGLLSFARPGFGTRGLPLLYRPPWLGVRALIGLELQF